MAAATTRYISQDKIEDIADQIRKAYLRPASAHTPIDIEGIASSLNCSIEVVDFEPSNISARVIRTKSDPTKYTIQVSSSEGPLRRRFSVAHEVSHIILHDDGKDEFIELRQPAMDYLREDMLFKEVQANMLAAAILLPKDDIKKVWEEWRSVDRISEVFNVSKSAASIRLDGMGLLESE